MTEISPAAAGGLEVCAFLDMLAFCEGTSTSPATRRDGYDVIVTGIDKKPEVFTDFSDHPFAKGRAPKQVTGTIKSSASGRYQQMRKDWPHYKELLSLIDFGPISQDRVAIRHIKECKALDDVKAGRIEEAVRKVARIWASLPGAGYAGQGGAHTMEDCLRIYRQCLTKYGAA